MFRSFRLGLLYGVALLTSGFAGAALAEGQGGQGKGGDTLVVSRIQYVAPTPLPSPPNTFPQIFNNASVSGIQGNIFLDYYGTKPGAARRGTLALTATSVTQGQPITTSVSSQSEGSLHLSVDGHYLTHMGYNSLPVLEGVSNSETTNPNAQITGATGPFYDRAVALIKYDGTVTVTPQNFAYSGDNPRGAISLDGQEFYMAGNSDSTLNKTMPVKGPGLTIGARLGMPGSPLSIQLGTYVATDRPDETAKQHIKDNNWRGMEIFNNNLYISKGSGGNGDDGIFQVVNGTGTGLPTAGTNNTIVQLIGNQATNPATGASSPLTPFGFFFANPTTLYVADEGNATITTTDDYGNSVTSLVSDPLAGLQKWVLIDKVWHLEYVLQAGLHLNEPENIVGYPVATYTTGIRNLTGSVNGDGTVSIFAITAQTSSIAGGEPDPTKLVMITDVLAATSLPAKDERRDHRDRDDDGYYGSVERFVTLQTSRAGEVFRGVAFAPKL